MDVYRYAGREPDAGVEPGRTGPRRERGPAVVAEDPFTICRCPDIDVIVDVTGSVEFGARSSSRRSETASRSC
jgi:predicted homoserine dehydrogenase-like protein